MSALSYSLVTTDWMLNWQAIYTNSFYAWPKKRTFDGHFVTTAFLLLLPLTRWSKIFAQPSLINPFPRTLYAQSPPCTNSPSKDNNNFYCTYILLSGVGPFVQIWNFIAPNLKPSIPPSFQLPRGGYKSNKILLLSLEGELVHGGDWAYKVRGNGLIKDGWANIFDHQVKGRRGRKAVVTKWPSNVLFLGQAQKSLYI